MAAAVAGRALLDRVMVRGLRFLRQPGQRVELADDADHRLAGAERRDERGGHAGDAGRDLEAGGLQLLLQQRAALLLLVADLGEAPDLLGDARRSVSRFASMPRTSASRSAADGACADSAATDTMNNSSATPGFRRIRGSPLR